MFPGAPSSFGSTYNTGFSQNMGYGSTNTGGYNAGYNFFGGNAGGDVMDSRDNTNVWSQFFGLG